MSPEEKYQEVTANISDTKAGKMFGALCIKTPNGKAACMYHKGNMVFKLKGDDAAVAASLDGAQTFEPSPGKKMNGWIQVPFDYAGRWAEFAQASVAYVKNL